MQVTYSARCRAEGRSLEGSAATFGLTAIVCPQFLAFRTSAPWVASIGWLRYLRSDRVPGALLTDTAWVVDNS